MYSQEVSTLPLIGVVVLSQGTRQAELTRCLGSALAQRDVRVEVVCVGNGWEPVGLPSVVKTVALPNNVGIPEGRNVGARQVGGDIICFLDDDAWVDDVQLFAEIARRFEQSPKVASLQPHVCDDRGETMRRWVPRINVSDPTRPGPGFTIAECVMFMRRSAFDEVGGWAGHFWYAHEGIDLAWRLWDAGWEVYYAGDLVAHHPATNPARHAVFYRHNARNRVWIARRNLPLPLLVLYLVTWSFVTMVRLIRQPRAMATWWGGFVEGFRTDPGPRRPMRWATILHLARLGHPPII